MLRIVDVVVHQGQLKKNASKLFPFKNGRCAPRLQLVETSGTQVHLFTVQGSGLWKGGIQSGLRRSVALLYFLHGNKAKGLDDAQYRKMENCCSKMMSQHLVYLAAAEGSLFATGLENGKVMIICRQQWAMVICFSANGVGDYAHCWETQGYTSLSCCTIKNVCLVGTSFKHS